MIKLALIGTGGMANAHARSFNDIRGVKLVAACDVDAKRVAEFAKTYSIPKTYTSVEALLAESDCDAVSVVTPDTWHAPISLQAMKAGKHVLCEKPLATNYPDAKKMADAARRRGVINMVNFSYRNASALQAAADLVASGKLGEVRHVSASYLQSWLTCNAWGEWTTSPTWLWRLSSEHGSKGVLGDIGVHILDFASYPVGKMKSVNCKLHTFKKARGNKIGPYKLDANDSALIRVEFANGAMASVETTRFATGHINRLFLSIHGTLGALRMDLDTSYDEMEVCLGEDRHRQAWKTVKCKKTPSIYQRFVNSIRTGDVDQAGFKRGAEIQKALDACFVSDAEDRTIQL
ncbi:MAG: Gfo/Idh/MocA family oxidoreductase [Verrucomicrobia bacterium]|nr:Gfo/Idh/MocA family oxidoreductase [Verrucomicrobiota bacterium]MCH8527519.1 Gfo/Idh/MocA family oxidoreductase [Kiritimatiellia bacterium]